MNALKKLALATGLLASVLVGCGGGGGGGTSSSLVLGGTAAVGAPIVGGAIAISCAGGNPTTPVIPTTSSVGAWQFTLAGQTFPCAVKVSGGTINGVANNNVYTSIATSAGPVNITPLTDLIVANVTGSANPSTWFTALTPSVLAGINPAAITLSLAKVRSALNLPALNNIDPLTGAFTPVAGNAMDDILTSLQLALTSTGNTLPTLQTAASGATFTPPAGFSAAMNTGYAATKSGGAPVLTPPATVTANGATSTTINLSWTAVTGATSYNVYRLSSANVQPTAANKITANPIPATSLPSMQFVSMDLTASTAYYYSVTTLNPAGESVFSFNATATTLAASSGGSTSAGTVPTGFVARTKPSGALTTAPDAVVWTGSLFVALEANPNDLSATATLFSWTSPDGISWTRNATNLPNGVISLSAANGKAFMMRAVYQFGVPVVSIYVSTNGITWTKNNGEIHSDTASNGVAGPIGVKYLNGKYFASMDMDACNPIPSTDGLTWGSSTSITALKTLILPAGYSRYPVKGFCSEPFYVNGQYIVDGGFIISSVVISGVRGNIFKGLVYSSLDGFAWTVNTIDLPTGINDLAQAGRVSLTTQVGSKIVMPRLQNSTTISGRSVLSNQQYATSVDGLTYAFNAYVGAPYFETGEGIAAYTNLILPSGTVGYTVTYLGTTPTYTYAYTNDGTTFTSTTDLMFTNPLMAAYSPTLRRLVVIRQENNASTGAQTGITIGTLDIP